MRAGPERPLRATAMIFNSLTFLVFFALVLAMHNAPFFSWHQKKINLLLASYLFYAAWNPPFVILLWVSTVVDWWAAQWMVRAKHQRTRKAWMLISVVVNIGMLGYFKYGGFLLENFIDARRVDGRRLPAARSGTSSCRSASASTPSRPCPTRSTSICGAPSRRSISSITPCS